MDLLFANTDSVTRFLILYNCGTLKNLEFEDKEVRKSVVVPAVYDILPDDCMTFVLSVIKAKLSHSLFVSSFSADLR